MTETHSLVLYEADTARGCGGCSLCCKLLPMQELGKKANQRCQHQRFKTGCSIYARRPTQCRYWSCRWLLGNDTADIPRPDRCHYVIDPTPDFVRLRNDSTGEVETNVPVVQVWVDPGYPDAHHDPALRRFLMRRGEEGIAALIRYSGEIAFALFPPTMSEDRQWHEMRGGMEGEHTIADYFAAERENAERQKRK